MRSAISCSSPILAPALLACAALSTPVPAQQLVPTWFAPGPGGVVTTFTGSSSGGIVAGGSAGSVSTWFGTAWTPVASPLLANVSASMPDPAFLGGFLLATGIGEVAALGPFGLTLLPPLPASVQAMTPSAAGNPVAGTLAGVFEFIGGAWTPVGGAGAPVGTILDVDLLANGLLVAGGSFVFPGSATPVDLAAWTGSSWRRLDGKPPGIVETIEPHGPNGLVAAFRPLPGTARTIWLYDGVTWRNLAGNVDATVDALAVLPNGDVVAGGAFTRIDGVNATYLARWKGTGWAPLVSSIDGAVLDVAYLAEGALVVGGAFTRIDGFAVNYVALFGPTVPGTVASVAAGCGANLQSIVPPFVGGVHTSLASGLAPGLGLRVLGTFLLVPPIPIAQLIPGVTANCVLDVAPEHIDTLTVGATATITIALPNDPALVGAQLFQQLVDLGAAGTQDVTNAQSIVIGAF
jgi:hypothetical protein